MRGDKTRSESDFSSSTDSEAVHFSFLFTSGKIDQS